tara:strand:+ start:2195 stop:2374 length:180 start_codon:yes stop_codon:yes gene_type:complete
MKKKIVLGLIYGAGIGLIAGILANTIAIGLALGAGVGLVLGAVVKNYYKKNGTGKSTLE